MNLLHEVPEMQARRGPRTVALRFEGHTVTYAELQSQIERATAVLSRSWAVRPGDRVAWLGGNHPRQLVLLFALARLGAILLPINFRLAPAEWDRAVRECGPRHIVHDAAWGDAARGIAARCGLMSHDAAELEAADAPVSASASGPASSAASADVPPQPESPALLVYTSGTTGGPKAAIHTQANLLANMRIAAQAQRIDSHDVVLTVLPMFHVGGLCIQTLPALWAGAQVILHARFDPGETLACIARDRPSLTLQVPATMKALVEHAAWSTTDLSCLRAVWAGSSVLPPQLIQAFHARGVPVCNVYGSTETGPFSIALPPERAFDHAGSCGWPAPEVEAKRVEMHGGTGEVLLRAPNIVHRYWPDMPARDAEGWFHTGDLATVAGDGSYTIAGRAKELIISGGENIHPTEIEAALGEHPAVAECAAFGVPDAQWGEVVAVAVVRKSDADEAQLRDCLAARVAKFKLPKVWIFVDALPKTALGKVQRSLLKGLVSADR